jgi:CRISPR/Cas system CSM-associated protein Csm2 small subunit
MKELDQFPKVMKKLVRYIKQDASINQLEQFKKVLDYTIEKRMRMLKKISQE